MIESHAPELMTKWRYAPAAAFAAVLLLIGVGIIAGLYEDDLYRTQKIQESEVQARILANAVSAALVFNDQKAAQGYVSALFENPEILAAGVYGANGLPFAGFLRDGNDPLPASAAVTRSYSRDGLVFVTIPIVQNQMQIGFVHVREAIDTSARRLLRYGGLILLATFSLFMMSVMGFSQLVLSRANTALTEQASSLKQAYDKLSVEMRERGKAEAALRQAQKMEAVGQLSGGIAHDFNNLITIAKGNLKLMQRRLTEGKTDTARYTTAVSDALDRAAALTQRILAFARQQPLSPKPVSLSELIDGMNSLLEHSAGAATQIETRLDADWWTVCDANQMENVILNLAINARDAMPGGGKLIIETHNVELTAPLDDFPSGEYVQISVRDTGSGMSEDVRQKAIDPFFTTKPVGQGTGLGLSVAFGFVRQSQGHLLIESALGRGTTVQILLPRYNVESLSESA